MKLPALTLVTALFLAAALSSAKAHDILANGDFSDGKTHWQGDGEAPDTGGRLVITLNPDRWTAVRQTFSANSKEAKLKITYTLSDDCSLMNSDMGPPLTAHALEKATGLDNNISDVTMYHSYAWMVLLVSGGSLMYESPVSLGNGESNPHTYTTTISEWAPFNNDALCLAFPPGKGSVTITSVSIEAPKSDQ